MLRLASVLLACVLWSVVAKAADETPLQYTKALLDDFKKLKNPDKLSPAQKAANDRIVDKLDRSFDFEGITTKLMKPREDKFTAAEKETFRKKFHQLIRTGTFVDTGDFFKKAKIEFLPDKTAGGLTTVSVHVTIPAEDTDTVVGLQWKKEGSGLKVVDVFLDGDSLVKDYQNQVARIVDKKGVAGLMKTLDEKIASAEKAKTK